MGIEMGMGMKSSGLGGNGNFVVREISTASDSHQIYSNLQIEFTITVAQAGHFWYHLYPTSKSQRTCYVFIYNELHMYFIIFHFMYVDLLTLCSLYSVSFGNGNKE